MKQFKLMSFLLAFLSFSFVFVACKQQDKSQMLIGEWQYKNTITAQHEVWDKPNETITSEKTIKFDGDGKVLYRHKSTSQYVSGPHQYETFGNVMEKQGTYQIKDNDITIVFDHNSIKHESFGNDPYKKESIFSTVTIKATDDEKLVYSIQSLTANDFKISHKSANTGFGLENEWHK